MPLLPLRQLHPPATAAACSAAASGPAAAVDAGHKFDRPVMSWSQPKLHLTGCYNQVATDRQAIFNKTIATIIKTNQNTALSHVVSAPSAFLRRVYHKQAACRRCAGWLTCATTDTAPVLPSWHASH
jgi:hypothetical protein